MQTNKYIKIRKKIYPYLFILPFALLTFMFFILPAIATVCISFTDLNVKMEPNFIGLSNYIRIFNDYSLGEILKNTVIYAAFLWELCLCYHWLLQFPHSIL